MPLTRAAPRPRHDRHHPLRALPTGPLHVGNIRTALHNWLFAQGQWRALPAADRRHRRERVARSASSTRSAPISPGSGSRPTARSASRRASIATRRASPSCVAAGRVYPAYETAQELDLKRKVLLGRGLPPIYDRAALALSDAERARSKPRACAPHWRFRLDHDAPIEWDDLVRGPQRFDPATMSDPVVRRADGSWLYLLPSVIDDIDMGITHVVRGEDHVSNTASAAPDVRRAGRRAARASRTRRC